MPAAVRLHPGVTLLELVVALAIVGVGAALVAPALRLPPSVTEAPDPVASGRALALRRGEALELVIGDDAHWTLHARRGADQALATGTVRAARAAALPARLLLTPTGSCLPLAPIVAAAWDPVRCAVRTP